MGRLIIDGKRVYEVDELCLKRKKNMNTADGAIKKDEQQRTRHADTKTNQRSG